MSGVRAARMIIRRFGVAAILALSACASGAVHHIERAEQSTRARLAPTSPAHLLVLGDSIAFGQGASEPRRGFAFVLYEHVAAKHPRSTVINHAIGGARLADVTRLELTALPRRVDAVVIEAGANDVVRGGQPAAIRRDAQALLRALHRQYHDVPIILCGIPDLSISPIFSGMARQTIGRQAREDDAALREVAGHEAARFIDVSRLTREARPHPELFLASDDFHPSDRGHAAIAKLIEPLLDRVLTR